MIETTAKILIGIIVGVALCAALTISLFVDLLAPETRPSVRRARSYVLLDRNFRQKSLREPLSVANAASAWSAERSRVRSMSEAHT